MNVRWIRSAVVLAAAVFVATSLNILPASAQRTVRIELNDPDASFLAALTAGVFSIVDSKTVKAQGGVEAVGADTNDQAEQWFNTSSAGSGPYRLIRYTRETEIVLERFDRYFGPKPFFRQIIIRHVKDPSTQALMVQRGDADLALDLSVDQAESLMGKPGIQVFEDPSGWTVYLGLNTAVSPWNNPKVRQAVKHAIDYDAIVKQLMGGHGRRISSIMMPGMLGFTEVQNKALLYSYDPAKAAALMGEAGVPRASISLTWAAGGNYGALPLDRLAQKLRTDFERIGIDLRLEPLQQSIFLTQYRQGKPETAIGFWFPDFMDPDNWSYFVTGFINRRLRWESPDGQRLVEEARMTGNAQQRTSLYAQDN